MPVKERGGPFHSCGQVTLCTEGPGLVVMYKRCDRHQLGASLVPSEAALVTSKRSGVVTRAAIRETARVCDGIMGLQRDYVFLYCRYRSILTVATACTVAIERTRTL